MSLSNSTITYRLKETLLGTVLGANLHHIIPKNSSLDQVYESVEKMRNMGAVIMERALKLLEHVVDGSLEEGVSYGKESK